LSIPLGTPCIEERRKILQNLVMRSKGKEKPLERHRRRWNLTLKWILKGKEKGFQWFNQIQVRSM